MASVNFVPAPLRGSSAGERSGRRGGRGVCGRKGRSVRMDAAKQSTVGRVTIAASAISLGATFLNRLLGPETFLNAQSRADILAVASGATLLLFGIANLDVNAREEETVELDGEWTSEIRLPPSRTGSRRTDDDLDAVLLWLSKTILAAIPNIQSVLLYSDDDDDGGETLLRYGLMGSNASIRAGPILRDALQSTERTYFGKLQILPGRLEFDYLPSNAQAILIQPIVADRDVSGGGGEPPRRRKMALILGSNKVRPLTSVDFGWLEALTTRISALDWM